MNPLPRACLLALVVHGCASRGGYAEPGPQSPNTWPPSPAGIQAGNPLQAGTATGRSSERPPTVNLTGGQVPDDRPSGAAASPTARGANDDDCVPAACCHATACVLRERAPACAGVACTMDCAPGTLDCGQGRCACVAGRCGAVTPPRS